MGWDTCGVWTGIAVVYVYPGQKLRNWFILLLFFVSDCKDFVLFCKCV